MIRCWSSTTRSYRGPASVYCSKATDGIEVIGQAADGMEAVELSARLTPDVVLMDIRMPRLGGIAATSEVLHHPTPPRVLILTSFDTDENVFHALGAGAVGFLVKDETGLVTPGDAHPMRWSLRQARTRPAGPSIEGSHTSRERVTMRRTIYFVHTTLNGRISDAEGGFWEPFPWGGEKEMAYNNEFFRTADTWLLGRVMYEGIVPWWEAVAAGEVPDDVPDVTAEDREFARLQHELRKVVVSNTLQTVAGECTEISRDPVGDLWKLKRDEGKSILVSCGPSLFSSLMAEPGLIDELLIVMHPVALDNGPLLFNGLRRTVPLKLLSTRHFRQGALVVRYATDRS